METAKKRDDIKIESLESLKKISADRKTECYVLSESGKKSRKDIKYITRTKMFVVYHHIDGEYEVFNGKQFSRSFIGTKIRNKEFFKYN